MSKTRRLSYRIARDILDPRGQSEHPGLIEMALGFKPATTSFKSVHLMNDLAQCVLGGAPDHGGDFLCRIIREDEEDEENSEEQLRRDADFGAVFGRAYPVSLGHKKIRLLRRSADVVLNADKGVYKPGTSMASSLATHRDLLGFEGFRRFKVGAYLAHILGEEGRSRLRQLYTSTADPVSRAFRPLFISAPLVEKQTSSGKERALSAFDESLGRALTRLLSQPLSKPTLLRYCALGGTLGIVLKILGVGRPNGRPVLLALADHDEGGPMPLREQAVQSMKVAIDDMDRHLARLLSSHPLAETLWRARVDADEPSIEVPATKDLDGCALDVISGLRTFRSDDDEKLKDSYWPDAFAMSLGRRAGIIHPKSGGFGWGKRLVLTAEMVEVLVLMFVAPGTTESWRTLWTRIRDHLGIVIGAQAHLDAEILESSRLLHVSLAELSQSADIFLTQAVHRGVARRLPDSGAQAGGELS